MNTNIKSWRAEYANSLENWHEEVGVVQQHFAECIAKNWPKNKYIARNLPFAQEQIVMCPPHSILNFAPNQQHRIDYGTGIIEGLSAEPVLNNALEITGINVVLHQPRIERLRRSLNARGYKLQIPIEKLSQVILDTVAVHGRDINK